MAEIETAEFEKCLYFTQSFYHFINSAIVTLKSDIVTFLIDVKSIQVNR
jgi:hypothetical protein